MTTANAGRNVSSGQSGPPGSKKPWGTRNYIVGVITGSTTAYREARSGYLFTLPTLIYIIIIFFIPAAYTIVLSVRNWNIHGFGDFVGLQSYVELLTDPLFRKSLVNTLIFTLLSVPMTVFFALLAALAFQSRTRLPGRNLFKAGYFLPLIVSLVAVAFVWKWMFNPSIGLLNNILRSLGLPEQGFLNDTAQVLPSLSIMYVWARLGFAMVIFVAGLESVPNDYYDASSIDGASRWQQFRHITFPLLNPQLVLVIILEVITSLRTFDLPYIAAQGGPAHASRTVVLHIYDSAFQYFHMSTAAAAAIVLFVLILALTLLQRRVLSRQIEY
ncbi:MAG: sugar ABC transporter permease [Chloroflexota bacterium]|nr:sugar ABC transporter permease [Chloroflexota bacterium]